VIRLRPLLPVLALALAGCAGGSWETRASSPGHYELTHTGGEKPEALRPQFERRARKLCPGGHELAEPQVVGHGWHGNLLIGEGPTLIVRADVQCNPHP
jgi:hypothetical protein